MMRRARPPVGFLLLLLVAPFRGASAQKETPRVVFPDFGVIAAPSDSDARALAWWSVSQLSDWLFHKHTCAEPFTYDDARALIRFDKMRQLLGYKGESILPEIGGALGARYAVTGKVMHTGPGQPYRIRVVLFDMRRSKELNEVVFSGSAEDLTEFPEEQVKKFFKPIPDCPLRLVIDQQLRSKDPGVVGSLEGSVDLEMDGDNDVEGDGSLEGVLVPLIDNDKAAREASIGAEAKVKVEGRREKDRMKLNVRSTAVSLSAGDQNFGGRGGGSIDIDMLARAGAVLQDMNARLGGYDAIITYRLVKR